MENDNFIEGKQSQKTTVPDAYYEATVIRTAVSAQGWTNRLVAHIKSGNRSTQFWTLFV